jgi:hypothetical protein
VDQDYISSALSMWTRNSDAVSERVRITQAGWMGIGTSSPSAKLHVASGAAQVDGKCTINAGAGVATTLTLGNQSASSTPQLQMQGSTSETRLYAWSDGNSYLQHANTFGICEINSTTPQFQVSSTGSTTCGAFTATGAISLPASSVGVAAISGLATIATSGAAANLSGTLAVGNIPNLPASQITSGTFTVGAFGSTNVATTGTLVSGVHTCVTIQVSNYIAPTSQGSSMAWNRVGGTGAACFMNQQGGGGGGWEWVGFSGASVLQQVAATLTQSGGLTLNAGLTCTSLTATGSISLPSGSVGVAAISGLASIATTGTVTLANIPNLPASQITSGTFSVASFSSAFSQTAGLTNVLPGALCLNDQTDTGNVRGVRWWASGNNDWATYMTTAGATKSTASGTTCASLDGRISHQVRNRAGNGSGWGFLWQNSAETCLMSLTSDTGILYVKGGLNVVAGGTVSLPASSVGVAAISGLAAVATSGSAADLSAGVLAVCYDCAWLSLTALSTVTCNLWL